METKQVTLMSRVVSYALRTTGAYIVIRANPKQFRIHGVNASRSACFTVSFSPQFFEFFNVNGVVECGILAKSLMAVMKGQRVERLEMKYQEDASSRLHCKVRCRNGLRKTYNVDCIESVPVIESAVQRELTDTKVIIDSGELARILNAFQPNLDDVAIVAQPLLGAHQLSIGRGSACVLRVQSCLTKKKETESNLYTQLWIPNESVVSYSHVSREPTDVTCSLKDLKAMAHLCEVLDVNTGLYFDRAGLPILLCTSYKSGINEDAADWNAKLVLSTRTDSQLITATEKQNDPATRATGNVSNFTQSTRGAPAEESVHYTESQTTNLRVHGRTGQTGTRQRISDTVVVSDSENESGDKSREYKRHAPVESPSKGGEWDDTSSDDDDEFVDATPPHKRITQQP